MSDRYDIPPNDADLARRIGEAAARGDDPARAGDDPLLGPLAVYRDAAHADRDPAARVRNWTAVASQMAPASVPTNRAPLRLVRTRRPAVFTLGLAAAVALVLAVGVWFWTQPPTDVLLAFADDAPVTYTTADGSTVTLRPHSALYEADADAPHFRLDGEAFFDVTSDPDRVFTVDAGAGRVEVLGTQFDVSTWGGGVAVFLKEGRVRFTHTETNETALLEPGQAVRLVGNELTPPRPAQAEAYLDWLSGSLSFTNTPLRHVLDELAHHYALHLTAPDALLDETLTGRVPLGSARKSLEDLGDALGGRFVRAADDTYRFEKK